MDKIKDIGEFEKCFSCRKSLYEGAGRFRKGEMVFCIKCYKDKTKSCKDSEADENTKNIPFLNGNSSDNIVDSCN